MNTLNHLLIEAETIQAELESGIPSELNSLIVYAKRVAVFHARSGHMLAEAKKIMRDKKRCDIIETIRTWLKEGMFSAKVQNTFVEAIAKEEMYLVDWLDRINSDCVHQIDLIRSIISKEKEEMKMTQFIQ